MIISIPAILAIARSAYPQWPRQFRMDIDLSNFVLPDNLIQGRPISAYGTYFHDEVNKRAAAYLVYSVEGTGDLFTFKFVSHRDISYSIDLATGLCLKSSVPTLSQLPSLEFNQLTWIHKKEKYYRVEEWHSESNVTTAFGALSTRFNYLHSPVTISPNTTKDCYDVPKSPALLLQQGYEEIGINDESDEESDDDRDYGEPVRLMTETRLPNFAYPFEMSLATIMEFSCVVKGFSGVDITDIFSVPKYICRDE